MQRVGGRDIRTPAPFLVPKGVAVATKTLTANSVIVMNTKKGEHEQFFEGDEFDTEKDKHLLAVMGDHLFAEKDPSEVINAVDLHSMKVPDLLALAVELNVEPKSNRKSDLIEAIESVAVEGE